MCRASLFLGALALVSASQRATGQTPPVRQPGPTLPRATLPGKGSIAISAALVDAEMQVRPVPLHALLLTSSRDTVLLRTGVDGKATTTVAPGIYKLSSVAPVLFLNKKFSWSFDVTAGSGTVIELALTNDNAVVEVDAPSILDNRIDPAAGLFARLSRSVFRIQAGLSHGSGFLADTLGGVVITNAHVVEATEAASLSVVLDSVTRVRAQLLARDPESDVAILRIPSEYLADRVRIQLQNPVGKAPVVPGERLVAMGFPLNQGLTVTAGIASSVRAGAVISDVNINPGNSGGPLLNVAGEAVAINTFGDQSSQGGGPGVSGSVLISRSGPALARATAELRRAQPLSPEVLPVMPQDQMEIAGLKAYAATIDPKLYKDFAGIEIGGFDVTVQTPGQMFVAAKTF